MLLLDLNENKAYTISEVKQLWKKFRSEDPSNHAETFKTEWYNILMATINGRNDLIVSGLTPKETSNYIINLRKVLPE